MRGFLTVLLLFFTCCLTPAASVRAEGRFLVVNQVRAIGFAPKAGNASGVGRASRIAGVLDGVTASAISSNGDHRIGRLMIAGQVVATVDKAEAKVYGLSPGRVVAVWAKRLRETLSLPPIRPSAKWVRLGVGRREGIDLVGSEADRATVEIANPSIASATRQGNRVIIQALNPGLTSLRLTSGLNTVTIPVRSMPVAAQFPQRLEATVTGAPATVETVRGALKTAIRAYLQTAPNTQTSFDIARVESIGTGLSRTYRLHVKANSPEAFPAEGPVEVTVRNVPIPPKQDGELWFCNRPESVKGPRELFAGNLLADKPVRMLYHHYNASGTELAIRITVANESDVPADVALIPGDSDPSRNPTLAGMRAADQFARNWAVGSSEIVRIPPRTRIPITIRRLFFRQTMSGLCSMRLLPNGPERLLVRAEAIVPFVPDARWRAALASSTPWREVGPQALTDTCVPMDLEHSDHVYKNPTLDRDMMYRVGDQYAVLRLGTEANINHRSGERVLRGNYGVVYNLRTTIENPTTTPIVVDMMFRASGGYSGGLFLVDGNVVRTPLLLPKQEVRVLSVRVEPGLRRFLMIQTLPLSGSNYPATITLRARDLLPPIASSGTR